MWSWRELIQRAGPPEHLVQLYGNDDQLLMENVILYLLEGLTRGDGLLVIGTPSHREAIIRHMSRENVGTAAAIGAGRLVLLDAAETLDRFMVNGEPDWPLFEQVVRGVCETLGARAGVRGVRAFGEMVGLLWTNGQHSAAIRLEEYWNRLLQDHAICLYCAYPIDPLGGGFEPTKLQALLEVHTHLLAGPRTMFSSVGPAPRLRTASAILPAS
ncbi:MAG: MEDS domain-containing protein [Gemmatimonadales bacterium]